MKRPSMCHRMPWFSLPASWRVSFVLSVGLAACASGNQNAVMSERDSDAGSVEIVNASPKYLLTIATFDDSQECRGPRYIAELEKFDSKSIRLAHRETLSLWITYTTGKASGLKTCGAVYSLPYTEGDLRVVSEASDSLKQCVVRVSWSRDGKTWAAVPDFRKRVGHMAVLEDDPRCGRE